MESLPNLIGLVGVAIEIVAYALVASGRWSSAQPRYQIVNIVGTSMILYSLMFAWNLPSVVMQIIWIFFSIIGLVRWAVARKRRPHV